MQYGNYRHEIRRMTDSLPRRTPAVRRSVIEELERLVIDGYNQAPHEARLKDACDYAVRTGNTMPLDFSEEELNFIDDK